MDRGLAKIVSRNLARRIARGSGGVEYLQDIYFDSSKALYFCKGLAGKAGYHPVLNQVPVFQSNGVDDRILTPDFTFQAGSSIKFRYDATGVYLGQQESGAYYVQVVTVAQIRIRLVTTYTFDLDVSLAGGEMIEINRAGHLVTIYIDGIAQSKTNDITETGVFNQIGVRGSSVFSALNLVYFETKQNTISFYKYYLQHFSGNKIFDISGNDNHATISGSGIWWQRIDGNISNWNQIGDLKVVNHDAGIAYVNANISDDQILAAYTGANIELLTGMYKDDGSRMNLNNAMTAHLNPPYALRAGDLADNYNIKVSQNEIGEWHNGIVGVFEDEDSIEIQEVQISSGSLSIYIYIDQPYSDVGNCDLFEGSHGHFIRYRGVSRINIATSAGVAIVYFVEPIPVKKWFVLLVEIRGTMLDLTINGDTQTFDFGTLFYLNINRFSRSISGGIIGKMSTANIGGAIYKLDGTDTVITNNGVVFESINQVSESIKLKS